jgi:SPP1 gp7 family putative phage head morphogenesis protein
MYVDKAHSETDKILAQLEKQIKAEYNKAYKEVKRELTEIMNKLSLTPDMSPQQRLALMNKKDRLESMIKQYSQSIKNANATAVNFINKDMSNVYKKNYNFEADKLGFSLIDDNVAKKLITKEASPFTKLAIDEAKDKNAIIRKLTSEMTTSVLKGESIPQMARRIRGIMENNLADSVRIARTETTRVENSARMDVGKEGEKLGFKMYKEWVATSDDRTRPEHASADGQRVPINEPFIVGGEKLMYPGDYSLGASPWNTINCRCTVVNITEKTYEPQEKEEKVEFLGAYDLDNSYLLFTQKAFDYHLDFQAEEGSMFDKFYLNLDGKEKDAIYTYTGGGYERINSYLRGLSSDDAETLKDIANLSKAIDKFDLTENIQVKRYSTRDMLKGLDLSDPASLKGKIIKDNAFLSTSTAMQKDNSHFGKVRYIIDVPKGKGRGAYIAPASQFPTESEFLLKKGSSFLIKKAEYDEDGNLVVHMILQSK